MTKSNTRSLYNLPACAANDKTGWSRRHLAAIGCPKPGLEAAFVGLLRAWLEYADAHASQYESTIGQDGVLGPEWARVGAALRGLLNGDLGRMDGGTLDGLLCDMLTDQDFNPDEL